MNLPLLSLDLPTFEANRRAMFELCERAGAFIAPHAKTPMSPLLAASMIEHGAWGASVADIRQAGVMLSHGVNRILIANEIGGRLAAGRLAALLGRHRRAEVFLFVNSLALVEALHSEWLENPELPCLNLLVEVGCGRGGLNTQAEVEELVRACADLDCLRIRLAGVAAYEGTVSRPVSAEMQILFEDLFVRVKTALATVRGVAGRNQPLFLSAGGSTLFDMVIARVRQLFERTETRDCCCAAAPVISETTERCPNGSRPSHRESCSGPKSWSASAVYDPRSDYGPKFCPSMTGSRSVASVFATRRMTKAYPSRCNSGATAIPPARWWGTPSSRRSIISMLSLRLPTFA